MARNVRRQTEPAPQDGPISEALREAVRASGATPYALAKASGISKAHLYRFLKGDRDLSQAGLNRLASHLGVKFLPAENRSGGRTESGDSGSGPDRPTPGGTDAESAEPDILTVLLRATTAVINHEFDAFMAGHDEPDSDPRATQPGLLGRLRGWLKVPNGREWGSLDPLGDPAKYPAAAGKYRLYRRSDSLMPESSTALESLLELRESLKLRVHESIMAWSGEFRSPRPSSRHSDPQPGAVGGPG